MTITSRRPIAPPGRVPPGRRLILERVRGCSVTIPVLSYLLLLVAALALDATVRPRNTEALAARIRARGGPVEARLYPGVGHVGIITAFAPLFDGRAPVLDDVWRFIGALPPSPAAPRSRPTPRY